MYLYTYVGCLIFEIYLYLVLNLWILYQFTMLSFFQPRIHCNIARDLNAKSRWVHVIKSWAKFPALDFNDDVNVRRSMTDTHIHAQTSLAPFLSFQYLLRNTRGAITAQQKPLLCISSYSAVQLGGSYSSPNKLCIFVQISRLSNARSANYQSDKSPPKGTQIAIKCDNYDNERNYHVVS